MNDIERLNHELYHEQNSERAYSSRIQDDMVERRAIRKRIKQLKAAIAKTENKNDKAV